MSSAFKIQSDGLILGSPEMGCRKMLGLEKLERSSGLCGAAGRPELGLTYICGLPFSNHGTLNDYEPLISGFLTEGGIIPMS